MTPGDSALVVDIDLAILGQPAPVYDRFENEIGAEYAWVPRVVYASRRREILRSFLDRERIYAFREFQTRYESAARENIERAIGAL